MIKFDSKEKMYKSLLSLASEKGYHSVKISDITEMSGVAKGTFYTYFKNKEDCFKQASQELSDGLHNWYVEGFIKNVGDIDSLAERVFNSNWQNKKVGRLYASEILSIDESFAKFFATQNKNIYKEVLAVFLPDDIEESLETKAFMIMGIIDALVFEVFACDGATYEQIKERFTKAFIAIVNAKFN